MEANSRKQYFTIALLLSLAIAVTIHFPMIMDYIFREYDSRRGSKLMTRFTRLGVELLITYVVALLMFTLNFFILKPVERHGKLKLWKIIVAIGLTVASVFILNHYLYTIKDIIDIGPRSKRHRDEFDYTNFFVSGLVIGCVLIFRLIFQKQTIMVENEELRRKSLQSQFDSLKNQLSPHFLFNSLTALKILIKDAPETAQIYVGSLSKALRYTLQSNEKELASLTEEMEFMESYLFLIRMRFDSNLSVNTSINENLLQYKLPPLTIQTLVENVIKHNEISKRKPLRIDIMTTGDESLIVLNEIQEKVTPEEGTGIGLTNLSKQFQILVNKEITITRRNNQFSVEVPLIKA